MCPKPLAPFQPLSIPLARAEPSPEGTQEPRARPSLLAQRPWHKRTAFARSLACHLSSISAAKLQPGPSPAQHPVKIQPCLPPSLPARSSAMRSSLDPGLSL